MKQLFSIQRKLDDRILDEHALERESLFSDKVLALLTEVGELANETRCFKYWSQKPASSKSVILEEYVDGVHFILSLGIDGGWEEVPAYPDTVDADLTEQFLHVFEAITSFKEEPKKELYLKVFQHYLQLGRVLGFSLEEVEEAYLRKNETNHQRQSEGY